MDGLAGKSPSISALSKESRRVDLKDAGIRLPIFLKNLPALLVLGIESLYSG